MTTENIKRGRNKASAVQGERNAMAARRRGDKEPGPAGCGEKATRGGAGRIISLAGGAAGEFVNGRNV